MPQIAHPKILRLVGDSHGDLTVLQEATSNDHDTIHLGDLGFASAWRAAEKLPRLSVVGGNHDDYSIAKSCETYLGDFGDLGCRVEGASGIFFVRGAHSIDRDLRIENYSWWAAEELSESSLREATDFYGEMKPKIVLSHDCPIILHHMFYGAEMIASRTSTALWRMLQLHEPEEWYFGHHHISWERKLGSTRFRALGIDEIVDLSL
jgi:hypothetical protein